MEEDTSQLEQLRALDLAQAQANLAKARKLLPRSEKTSSSIKVGIGEGTLILVFALVMDLLAIIPLIGILFALIWSGSMWLWTKTKTLGKPGYSLITALPLVGGGVKSIPMINMLPYCTAETLVTLATFSSIGQRISKLSAPAKV